MRKKKIAMYIVSSGHPDSTKKKPAPIITLGSGHRINVGDYMRVWRYVKEATDAERPV